jgi:rhodanese-related sulfurtransferase
MRAIHTIYTLSIILLATASGCAQRSGGTVNIDKAGFDRLVKEENAIVMDVRTPAEVSEGIIKGATVFMDFQASDFEQKIATLDKTKTYIVYCRSGRRSASATEIMQGKGFGHVYNLEGGITGWTGETTVR